MMGGGKESSMERPEIIALLRAVLCNTQTSSNRTWL